MDALNDIAEPPTIPAEEGRRERRREGDRGRRAGARGGGRRRVPPAGRRVARRAEAGATARTTRGTSARSRSSTSASCVARTSSRSASEVRILKGIQCENVVHLYECFDEAPLCYLGDRVCSGGELFDRIVKKKTCASRDFLPSATGRG